MFDTAVTLVGNVLTAPEWRRTSTTGTYVVTFRFASTSRRFDRGSNRWVDGDSLRVKVACWRKLGENVSASVQLGDPLVIYGRMYSRDWVDAEQNKRTSYELDAVSVGHDLSRGVSKFMRRRPAGPTDSLNDDANTAAIGGESSEPVTAPDQPTDLPDGESLADFDHELYEPSTVVPQALEDDEDGDLEDEVDVVDEAMPVSV